MNELNRNAAREQAEKKDFDPEDMLYCVECGRTVVRSRRGQKDRIYCTCEDTGYPMVPVEGDDD